MVGMILINSYMNLPAQTNQINRFVEEFKKEGIEVDVVKASALPFFSDSNIHYNLEKKYDFCLYLDKDKYIVKMLESMGIKVFNSSRSIELSDDKMLTHIELSNHNIPMPKTIPGVLSYSPSNKVDINIIDKVEKELGYPLIIKDCYGSLGMQVYLINNRKELIKRANKVVGHPHLFQEFIKESFGKDIRVICVGHKAIAWMERISEKDFRSNIGQSGKGVKIDLPKEFKKVAENASKILGLDYCGIDLLIGKDNKPILCEVNPKAFFNKVEEVSNVNVANALVTYIINSVKKNS